jgi:hypothetical protein
MKILYLTIFFFCFQILALGQYCTTTGPTSQLDSNVESVDITGEAGTFITYTGCPTVLGLEDLTTTESVTLSTGNSYVLNVQFGTCGNNYPGVGEAWIDFNGNELFEAGESIGAWSGTPPTAISLFNFTVPVGAVTGSTRLRIIQREGGTLPINTCTTFTYGSAVDFEVIITGGTSSYCTTVGPSSIQDSNIQIFYLLGEGGTDIDFTGCPGVIGLNDQTALESVDLAKNSSYSADVNFGTCGNNFNGAGEAWIDYNQNNSFEPSESIGTWNGMTPSGIINFSFTVPGTAIDGTSRLRVQQQENASTPLNPCASYTWGSTIDFEVIIGGSIDCSGYIGDDMADPRQVVSLPFQENHSNSV